MTRKATTYPGSAQAGGGPAVGTRRPAGGMTEESMIVESVMVVSGMRVAVSRSRRRGGFTAELVFEGGDRAVVDAGSVDELECLIEAVAYPAALARRCSSGTSSSSAGTASGASTGGGAAPGSAGSDRSRNFF